MSYDVAVIGLGAMGSAILAECAARGASAIGIEQFTPVHDRGSSHGRSRMIRKAYFEDPCYVPLLQRAFRLWRKLERDTGEELLRETGVLTVGEDTSEIIKGTRRAAAKHALPLQSLTRSAVNLRYPTVRLLEDEVAVFEPEAGVLDPERAVGAQLKCGATRGATMRFETSMRSWSATDEDIEVRLTDDSTVMARSLVLSLGPWFKETLEALGVAIRVQRNVQVWLQPSTADYARSRFPAFLLNRRGLPAPLYGFPDFGSGVKVAFHGFGDLTDADQVDREVNPSRDVDPLIAALKQWMPGAADTVIDATPCLYTLTPDHNFVIDQHPSHANVVLCGGFSGHGFKFAPVIGEIGADLALNGGSAQPIEFLSLRRFAHADGFAERDGRNAHRD